MVATPVLSMLLRKIVTDNAVLPAQRCKVDICRLTTGMHTPDTRTHACLAIGPSQPVAGHMQDGWFAARARGMLTYHVHAWLNQPD